MNYKKAEYNFEELDKLLFELEDFTLNKIEYYRRCYTLMRQHYVRLCTLSGELKGLTILAGSAGGRKDLNYDIQDVKNVFEDYGKISGYITLIDKSVILMQSIAKNLTEE